MAEPVRTPELVPAPPSNIPEVGSRGACGAGPATADVIDGSRGALDPKPSFFRRKPDNRQSHVSLMPGVQRHYLLPRLFSFGLLLLVGCGLFHAARAGFYLATDAQIAPLLLSPDSDLVTSSRLSLASLQGERDAVLARIEVASHALSAGKVAQKRLSELRDQVSEAGLAFSGEVATVNVNAVAQDQKHLAEQRGVLVQSIETQQAYVQALQRQLEAGIVRRSDLAREENELRRLQLQALQNQRDQLSSGTRAQEVTLTNDSMRAASRPRLHSPEVLRPQEQLLRIDLELVNLEADARGIQAQLEAEKSDATRLERLIEQIKARPVYRAVEQELLLAFVPYTQLDQVKSGRAVYQCRVWSVFGCEQVGQVAQVLAGEVATQDPWGSPARGQYAVLQLTDAQAAKAKVLRVREPLHPITLQLPEWATR